MKVITFYSYKGGSGRSLAVTNAALYLSRLGFRVVVIDLDLEAPGLHYKFALHGGPTPLVVSKGIVDYVYDYAVQRTISGNLREFSLEIQVPEEAGKVVLIPAGSAPSLEYWQKVTRLNWHELFYDQTATGIKFFLNFKAQLKNDFAPDFVLLDSRTGITEMSGLATSVLCDSIIALVTNSPENIEGARVVLRSVVRARREYGLTGVEMQVVISRLAGESRLTEDAICEAVKSYLNETAPNVEDTLSLPNVFVFHADQLLETKEMLMVGGNIKSEESPLLRDYLKLFAHMVSTEVIEARVRSMLSHARETIFDDPQTALAEVEELADAFGHAESYRELLRFYNVRDAQGAKVVRAAERLWELTGDSADEFTWQVVRRSLASDPEYAPKIGANPHFLVAIWRNAGKQNFDAGIVLARWLTSAKQIDLIPVILRELEELVGEIPKRALELSALYRRLGDGDNANRVLLKYGANFMTDAEFSVALVQAAVETEDMELLGTIQKGRSVDVALEENPVLYLRYLALVGRVAEAKQVAQSTLRNLRFGRMTPNSIKEAAVAFGDIGMAEEFRRYLRMSVGEEMYENRYRRILR